MVVPKTTALVGKGIDAFPLHLLKDPQGVERVRGWLAPVTDALLQLPPPLLPQAWDDVKHALVTYAHQVYAKGQRRRRRDAALADAQAEARRREVVSLAAGGTGPGALQAALEGWRQAAGAASLVWGGIFFFFCRACYSQPTSGTVENGVKEGSQVQGRWRRSAMIEGKFKYGGKMLASFGRRCVDGANVKRVTR